MTTPSFADSAMTIGNKFGRNFSIVGMVPTSFLVLWTYVLSASNSWTHAPELDTLGDRLGSWSVAGVGWLLIATLVLALFLHPLQFATIQLLEGYWGVSAVAQGATRVRVQHYRKRARSLRRRASGHRKVIKKAFDDQHHATKLNAYLDSHAADPLVSHITAKDELSDRSGRYPAGRRVMPTRLGNTLRRIEDSAGGQYGLAAIPLGPHLALTAPAAHLEYLDDSREELDTSVRLCFVSLAATVLTVIALFADGLWLLVALIPYTLAYVAYRASVAAADEYGVALSTIIDLDRFALYTQLGLEKPRDTAEERAVNEQLMALLGGEKAELSYARAPGTPPRRLYRPTRRLR